MKKDLLAIFASCCFSILACSSCGGGSSSSSLSSSTESSDSSSLSSSSSSLSEAHPGYALSWGDEFDGDSLDTSVWSPMLGNGQRYGIAGWGNNEAECYQEDNIAVKDGNLVITAKRENVTDPYGSYEFTSGRMRSAGKITTTYGIIEARIALPCLTATWPAFWMLPETGNWPYAGEIDIMENAGVEDITSAALHYAAASGSNVDTYQTSVHTYSKRDDNGTAKDYHVYGVEWSEEEISFYVDNTEFLNVPKRTWHPAGGKAYTEEDDAPFNKPFHILFNMAIGGNFVKGALPDASFTECDMKVDYVRIYEAI